MKRLMWALTLAPALVWADAFTGSGLVEAAPDWFGLYDAIVFGEGTLDVSGDATFAGPVRFNASTGKTASTVKVADGAVLTLAGGVVSTSGAMVKTGAGTLVVKGAYDASGAVNPPSDNQVVALAWNDDGKVVAGALPRGTAVHEGTLRLEGVPELNPYYTRVGLMGAAGDARLEIVDSWVPGKYSLYVGAAGSTNAPGCFPLDSLLVKDSAITNLYEYQQGHLGGYSVGNRVWTSALFDNAQVTNGYRIHIGAHNGFYDFVVSNRSEIVNVFGDNGGGVMVGMGQQNTTGTVHIADHSKLLTTQYTAMNLVGGGENRLVVSGGSTLGYTFPISGDNNAPRTAPVLFDGGILRPWQFQMDPAARVAGGKKDDWGRKINAGLFNEWEKIQVGDGGMTLWANPGSYGCLWAPLRRAAGASNAHVDVKGGGLFSISATDLPISVDENSTLAFGHARYLGEARGVNMIPSRFRTEYVEEFANDAITVAAGSKLRVRGDDYCLSQMVLPAADITFEGGGLMANKAKWDYTAVSRCNLMGDDSFVIDNGIDCGKEQAIHLKDKIDVTRSFRVTFDYYNAALAGRTVQGFAAFIHNDPRGTKAVGEGTYGLGYGTTKATGGTFIDKSVAMAITTWGSKQGHHFVRNGRIDYATWTADGNLGYNFTPDRDHPAACEIVYDAAAHTFSYRLHTPYGKVNAGWSNTQGAKRTDRDWNLQRTVPDVDLETILGATSGYLGFSGASDGGSRNQHAIANVSVAYLDEPLETRRPARAVAGALNLAAGTANLHVYGTDADAGYRMGELRFADGGTLDVTGTNVYSGVHDTSFVAFDTWTGSGAVNKTGAGNLGMVRQNASAATLNLRAGGLVLRRDDEDAYTVDPNTFDWIGVNQVRSTTQMNEKLTPTYTDRKGVWVGSDEALTSGGVALRRKLRVSGKWRLSCDVHDQGTGAYGALFTFHNDPRGYRAYNGRCKPYSGAVADDGSGLKNYSSSKEPAQLESDKVRNAFGVQCYTYHNGQTSVAKTHKVRFFTQSATGASALQETYLTDPQMYVANNAYKGCPASQCVGRKYHLDLVYDETLAKPLKVTIRQTQGIDGTEGEERVWTRDYAYDVKALTGGEDLCNFTIFFGCGGATTRARVDNFRFEHLDVAETAAKPYFGTVNATGSDPLVYLDAAKAYTYRLADAVSVSDGLTVRSLRAPGTLDLGAPTVAADATLVADGATLALSGKDGVDKKAAVAVANGGKLALNFAGSLQVASLTVDGTAYEKGSFGAEDLPGVLAGTGRIQVGAGMVLLIR